jgi:hypothetical protein
MEAAETERVLVISLHLTPVPEERAVCTAFQAEFLLIIYEFHDYHLWPVLELQGFIYFQSNHEGTHPQLR